MNGKASSKLIEAMVSGNTTPYKITNVREEGGHTKSDIAIDGITFGPIENGVTPVTLTYKGNDVLHYDGPAMDLTKDSFFIAFHDGAWTMPLVIKK